MSNRSDRRRRQQQQKRANAPARRQNQPRPHDPAGIVEQEVQQIFGRRWQGPIPDPDSLAKYQQIDPRLPDRIVAMAERTVDLTEKQTEHRIELERRAILGMNLRAHIGLWLAFVVVLVVLGLSFAAIFTGHEVGGSVVAGIDLASLAAVFVYGRHDQARQESSEQ